MNIAIAVKDDQISPSLGKTQEFVLLSENTEGQVPCSEKIPVFLSRCQIQLLICNGIGNCMIDLLNSIGIKVIPGISGNWRIAAEKFRKGTLTAGEKYSCTDHGKTCGECPGYF